MTSAEEVKQAGEIVERCLGGLPEMSYADQLKVAGAFMEFTEKIKPVYAKYFIGEKTNFLMTM